MKALIALLATMMAGCSGGGADEDAPAQPGPPLAFDPENAEFTFRWLYEQAMPIRKASLEANRERVNNPLRTEYQELYQQEEKRWDALFQNLIGKEVRWPVEVREITTQAVEVDGIPKEIEEGYFKVAAHYSQYPCDGR